MPHKKASYWVTIWLNLCLNFLPSFESPNRVEINIKNAKNDPFRNGCVLVAVANGSDTCPVQKMKQWLLIRGRKDGKGPLFKLNARDGV